MPVISNDSKQNTVTVLENSNNHILKKEFNWSNLYGELTQGEYRSSTSSFEKRTCLISFNFTIDQNGKITYEKPILDY